MQSDEYADTDPEFNIRYTRSMLPTGEQPWYESDRQLNKMADMLEEALEQIDTLKCVIRHHEIMLAEKGVFVAELIGDSND